ncbi:hypothetical protein JCM19047_720 [Bacillus sp. JCM 19047]|nr:hypothetical protein JCM19047_720 [Bacillus sp. JCM 19047]
MKAFLLWFDSNQAVPYQIVITPGQYHAEHAFVRIGDWFLDGDGVSTFDAMVDRWRYEEGLPCVFVRKFNPETEPDDCNGEHPLYISDKSIQKLVQILDSQFDKETILELLKNSKRP